MHIVNTGKNIKKKYKKKTITKTVCCFAITEKSK